MNYPKVTCFNARVCRIFEDIVELCLPEVFRIVPSRNTLLHTFVSYSTN